MKWFTLKMRVAVLLGLALSVALAQPSNSYQRAVDAYRAALSSAESRSAGHSLEAAFSALGSVRDALTRVRDGNVSVLESLSKEDFQRLQRELPGARINREEVVFVEPDPEYFARLAAARGELVDRRFFAALKATYPESVWPVYVEQQTDYSGCRKFGDGKLVEMYRLWSEFQNEFPSRYAAAAQKEISGVIEALTESTCACGSSASVQKEMQLFLRTFPASPIRAKVAERLQALRAGRSNIRTRCLSG